MVPKILCQIENTVPNIWYQMGVIKNSPGKNVLAKKNLVFVGITLNRPFSELPEPILIIFAALESSVSHRAYIRRIPCDVGWLTINSIRVSPPWGWGVSQD